MKTLIAAAFGAVLATLGAMFVYSDAFTPSAHIERSTEGTVLVSGEFFDNDPTHPASGSFEIVSDGKGDRWINFSEDFSIAKAPDPHLRVNGVIIARTGWEGKQSFPVPNFITDEIESVIVWCEKFDVGLAKSTLN